MLSVLLLLLTLGLLLFVLLLLLTLGPLLFVLLLLLTLGLLLFVLLLLLTLGLLLFVLLLLLTLGLLPSRVSLLLLTCLHRSNGLEEKEQDSHANRSDRSHDGLHYRNFVLLHAQRVERGYCIPR